MSRSKREKDGEKREGKLRAALGRTLLALGATIAAAVLILIYGTQTISWNDLYSLAGLTFEEPVQIAKDEVAVTVLSVGQGDAILIETPEMAVLIDGGDTYAGDGLCETLREKKIERLDYVFLTHPHKDHLGGLLPVLEEFEIGKLYVSTWPEEITPTSESFLRFNEIILQREIDAWRASTNEEIALDCGKLTVIAAGGYDELNDCSLVIRYDYGAKAFLFMGDASFSVEDDLMEGGSPVECDVLKAGHHGSRYSTSSEFLEAAGAQWVVASCGIDNQYDYPTEDFMRRVDGAGASLLRTDLDGDVRFVTDGRTIQYDSSREREAA